MGKTTTRIGQASISALSAFCISAGGATVVTNNPIIYSSVGAVGAAAAAVSVFISFGND